MVVVAHDRAGLVAIHAREQPARLLEVAVAGARRHEHVARPEVFVGDKLGHRCDFGDARVGRTERCHPFVARLRGERGRERRRGSRPGGRRRSGTRSIRRNRARGTGSRRSAVRSHRPRAIHCRRTGTRRNRRSGRSECCGADRGPHRLRSTRRRTTTSAPPHRRPPTRRGTRLRSWRHAARARRGSR